MQDPIVRLPQPALPNPATVLKPAALLICATLVGLAPARAADFTIDQKSKKFDRSELVLKTGDSITFANGDDVKHNLTVVTPDEESTDLGTESPGASVKYSPPKAGVYDVRCSIHPNMKMKLKVQ